MNYTICFDFFTRSSELFHVALSYYFQLYRCFFPSIKVDSTLLVRFIHASLALFLTSLFQVLNYYILKRLLNRFCYVNILTLYHRHLRGGFLLKVIFKEWSFQNNHLKRIQEVHNGNQIYSQQYLKRYFIAGKEGKAFACTAIEFFHFEKVTIIFKLAVLQLLHYGEWSVRRKSWPDVRIHRAGNAGWYELLYCYGSRVQYLFQLLSYNIAEDHN